MTEEMVVLTAVTALGIIGMGTLALVAVVVLLDYTHTGGQDAG